MFGQIMFIVGIVDAISITAVINHPNGGCGIRINATMMYIDVWKKCHRLTAVLCWIFTPILFLEYIFLKDTLQAIFMFITLFIPLAIGVIYALRLGAKKKKENEPWNH